MSTWINLDCTFGNNAKVFVIDVRSLLGQEVYAGLRDSLGGGPDKVREFFVNLIEHHRPELKGGLFIWGIECLVGQMRWKILAMHPSFPAVPFGSDVPVERLERCGRCHGEMTDERFVLPRATIGESVRYVEVCQSCYEKGSARAEHGK